MPFLQLKVWGSLYLPLQTWFYCVPGGVWKLVLMQAGQGETLRCGGRTAFGMFLLGIWWLVL